MSAVYRFEDEKQGYDLIVQPPAGSSKTFTVEIWNRDRKRSVMIFVPVSEIPKLIAGLQKITS